MYEPREDTRLLKNKLEELDLEDKEVLEIGAGKGEIGLKAWEEGAHVIMTDIDPDAFKHLKEKAEEKNRLEIVESDIFENISGEYDLILFNPPYLPGERENEKDPLNGGKGGKEVIKRFLNEFEEHLKEGGSCYFIISSKTDFETLSQKFDFEIIDSKKIWFETLHIAKTG